VSPGQIRSSHGGRNGCPMRRTLTPVCCIYHKPRAFDESSSESSGSDDDDPPPRKAYPKGKGHALRKRDGQGGQAEQGSETESSESEGGGGDGSAR
jgi:protein phosphatase 1 regulatory subunit 11